MISNKIWYENMYYFKQPILFLMAFSYIYSDFVYLQNLINGWPRISFWKDLSIIISGCEFQLTLALYC